ncbi:Predicted metal-dependent hydrolase, TIM-barrel fold [Maribacter dokdonensis]|uniref:Predicted metal-dependent hydrolase, TIM-barrel fold n=1 Tax=Maribacter dokdonensis TaxID=320912 RepID=A0ABY0UMR7_9FLAO|nr:amidohydrolase family protein [Maribacter dokdonensis]SDS91547.1 Predicted metal-dependent hydrolase, TIM-barrel fold [Maribacter dokdonensis]
MKIFDSHFHIINPKFPLVENNGYLPPDFTVENYVEQTKGFGIEGGAIVSGSFQKFDQEYLLDALKTFGENYFGVANIPIEMKYSELNRLDESNIRAVRFNLKRGGSESLKNLVELSNRLYDAYNWHTELYVDSKNLNELKSTLKQIPTFSIDHLGLSKTGLKELFYWAEKGVKIKATGFGRLDFNPITAMKKIYSINPDSLMFGTDLPSTRAKIPFTFDDLQSIMNSFSDIEQERILYQNATDWYKKNKLQ